MATKQDVELARVNTSAQKALAVFTLVGVTIKGVFALFAIYLIVDGPASNLKCNTLLVVRCANANTNSVPTAST
jgi:hypothetical protein